MLLKRLVKPQQPGRLVVCVVKLIDKVHGNKLLMSIAISIAIIMSMLTFLLMTMVCQNQG